MVTLSQLIDILAFLRKNKKFISILLLFVFGLLLTKSLVPGLVNFKHGNCDEFGHIHFYEARHSVQSIKYINKHGQSEDEGDETCHEGKSVFAYMFMPSLAYSLDSMYYGLVFDMMFSFENNYQSPYLEPHRKPPKFA